MVDEFQDTNRLQLDILEALERDNLFAVGDEFQSIYGFRHADVTIFRERRAALGEERARPLTANFRSREELLDVAQRRLRAAVGGAVRAAPGRRQPTATAASCGCSTPASRATPSRASSCWSPTRAAGRTTTASASPASRPSPTAAPRRASIAHRLRQELEAGRAARDIVVLVRATASLRLFEEALEEQGVPTYVVGGRGYWSQQPVRDGLAYLAALANPLDEEALLGALASPFCGVGVGRPDPAGRGGRSEGVWARCGAPRGGGRGGRRPASLAALPGEERERLRRVRRASSPPSGRTPSGCRSRCCSSGRSRRPATTSPSSPAPAASGGSPTCAS